MVNGFHLKKSNPLVVLFLLTAALAGCGVNGRLHEASLGREGIRAEAIRGEPTRPALPLHLGESSRLLIMDTGEAGRHTHPFVLVNRDEKELHFLAMEAPAPGDAPGNYLTDGGKFMWHFFRGWNLEMINRPVSSLSRLFFFLFDTSRDALRGVGIRSLQFSGLHEVKTPPLNSGPGMDLKAWEARLDRLVNSPRTTGRIELLVDGDAFFPRFVDALIAAERSIKVRTYIFDLDDYSIKLADLLKRRSKEVKVQVMLDGIGTLMAQRARPITAPPGFEPPLGITLHLTENSNVELVSLTNPWFTGDHTKTTIIDGERAFIGGMNIGREYRWEWHDMMMEVRGPVVDVIEREFDKTWRQGQILGDVVLACYMLGAPPVKSAPSGYPIRLLMTLPRDSQIYRAQIAASHNARSYIFIQNPYLSDMAMIYELIRARSRGVDVRVILPMEGNHDIMNASNVVAANILLKHGVRVFAYPGMTHVKAAIYDGWACLGSANLDKLSLRVNKEMNLACSDPDFTRELLENVFEPDFAASVELEKQLPEGWGNTLASIIAGQL